MFSIKTAISDITVFLNTKYTNTNVHVLYLLNFFSRNQIALSHWSLKYLKIECLSDKKLYSIKKIYFNSQLKLISKHK